MHQYACISVCKSFFFHIPSPTFPTPMRSEMLDPLCISDPNTPRKKKNDGTPDFRKTAGGYANSTTFTEFIILRTNRGVAKLTLRVTFLSYNSYLCPFDLTGPQLQGIHIRKPSRTSAGTTCQGDSSNPKDVLTGTPGPKMTWKFRWVGSTWYAFRRWKISRGFFVFPVPGWELFFGIWNCWWVWESNEECTICMHYFRITSTVGAFPSFHAGWKKRVSSGLCWVRRWGGLAFTLIWAEGMVPFPLFPLPYFQNRMRNPWLLQVEFATSSNAFLRQINSGFYRTGNSKHSQTITLQIKCNRFILSSIWSITVELSALCPQGMQLSATKKLKTTGMMWCKMWLNHTYPTKVCFQNRKPPCPLRQLSTKKQQIQWEVMYFSRLQPNTWKWRKRGDQIAKSFEKSSLLLWKDAKGCISASKNLQKCLLILHPNEVKRSPIWVQCMLRFSGFHLQKKRNTIWESSEVGFQSWHRLERNIIPIRPFLMCFSDKKWVIQATSKPLWTWRFHMQITRVHYSFLLSFGLQETYNYNL